MPPADEKTWRCQKTLHIVFAATTLLMLVATVWMTWKDHNREWKGHQRAGINAESKLLAWRADQAQPVQFGLSLAEAEAEVKLSRIALPKEESIEKFQKIASEVEDFNYDRLNEAFAELKPLVAAGEEAVAASRAARKTADDAQAAYRVAQQDASNENPVSEETAAKLAELQTTASEAAAEADRL
ncbi:MAG: hypothetical protein MI757_11940, partial [Pirellulales bacterium]|nr:hypothetical protein [Pirellulales bacterium]